LQDFLIARFAGFKRLKKLVNQAIRKFGRFANLVDLITTFSIADCLLGIG
jgi:hypothetical protein